MKLAQSSLEQFFQKGDPFQPFGPARGFELADNPLSAIGQVVVSVLLGLAGFVFTIAMVTSMVMYLFAGGSEELMDKGKRNIVYSLTGLIITFGGWASLNWLLFGRGLAGAIDQASAAGALARLIGLAITTTLAVSAIGFVLLVLFAGTIYLFSGGSEDTAIRAKRQLTTAITGIALSAAAFAIARFILSRLGLV